MTATAAAPDPTRNGVSSVSSFTEEVSFDEAVDHIGGLGRWHVRVIIIVCCVAAPAGFHNLAISFIAQTPAEFACAAAELAAVPYDVAVNLSVPMETTPTGKRRRARCVSYADRNYTLARALYDEDRLAEIPDEFYGNESEVACGEKGWRYNVQDGYITVVTQWDLVCGRAWLVATAQMLYFGGFLVGCVIFGSVSDRIGRRPTMLLVLSLMTVLGAVNACAPHYLVFIALRFLVGSTSAGAVSTAFVYAIEIVTPPYRNAISNMYQCGFAVGFMALPWLALGLQDWHHLQLTMSLWVVLLVVAIYFFVPESPRWLFVNGREQQCLKGLKEIAKGNRRTLPANINLRVDEEQISMESGASKKANIIDTVRTPVMRKKTLNLMFQWFVVAFIYYGLAMNSVNLGDDPYLAFFLGALVEIPAYFLTIVILAVLGRRLSLMGTLVLGGAACLVTAIPLPTRFQIITVILATIGKFAVTMSFAIIYLYSGEIYPTVIRNVGLGSNSLAGRIGSMSVPYIALLADINKALPMLIFGGFAVAASLLALLLPETKDRDLPETIEDGENFNRKGYIPSAERRCKLRDKETTTSGLLT